MSKRAMFGCGYCLLLLTDIKEGRKGKTKSNFTEKSNNFILEILNTNE